MEKETDIYNLSESIFHHKNILRSVTINNKGILVSGSFDKTCAFFSKKGENSPYELIRQTNYHDDYIYVVRSDIKDRGFFSGSKDAKIIFMDIEGSPLGEYIGHSGTVNDISQIEPETFISGSWDATAKVWDVETQKCLFTLKDHSYAVSTLALQGKRYITGSQDKKLKFWDRDQLVRTIDNAHEDIIRDIILSADGNTFYTCSNDYTIKHWTFDGMELETLTGHSGFVFRLQMRNNLLFSASDDKLVKTWSANAPKQSLLHPNTVWDLTINPSNGDLITACADGVIRVFSTDSSRWLSQEQLEEYTNLCLISNKEEEKTNDAVDVSKLPKFSEKNLIKNPKEGEIRVFNNNENAEAYVFKSGTWEKIGDVLGTKETKKYYNGDKYFPAGEYDYIFDVDLEGNPSKLPFNKGDNCLVAAEKFINREELHKGLYVDDITRFLRQNTQSSQSQGFKQVEKKLPEKSSKTTPKQNMKIKFPQTTYTKYDSINVDGPFKKVTEINAELISKNDNKALSSQQLDYFKTFLKTLSAVQFYHTSNFSQNEIDVFTKFIGTWSIQNNTPYLDCFRMFLLHPRSNDLFSKIGGGVQQITLLIEILKNGSEVQKTLILRILNNMFLNESSRIYMIEKRQDMLDHVSVYIDNPNKNIKTAIIGLLFKYLNKFIIISYSVVLYDKNDSESSLQVLSLINEMLINEKELKNICCLLLALGNMLSYSDTNRSIARDMDIGTNLNDVNFNEGTPEDLELVSQVKPYLMNLLY